MWALCQCNTAPSSLYSQIISQIALSQSAETEDSENLSTELFSLSFAGLALWGLNLSQHQQEGYQPCPSPLMILITTLNNKDTPMLMRFFTEHMMPYTLTFPKTIMELVSGKIFFMEKLNGLSQCFSHWTKPIGLFSDLEMSPVEQILESNDFYLAEKKELLHSLSRFANLWGHFSQNLQ